MSDRRTFLGTLAAAGAASLVNVPSIGATPIHTNPVAGAQQGKWDLSWVDAVKAKTHKQVFDLGVVDTGGISPLHFGHFWMEANKEVNHVTDGQLGVVFGVAGNSFPVDFKDSIWAKYPLGDNWKVTDPKTKAPAKRNVFADPAETGMSAAWTVQALQKRGVIFWMCNNALTLISGMMADATKQTHDAVYNEMKAGLLPGVKLVPSHTMMLGYCQEHGLTYQRV